MVGSYTAWMQKLPRPLGLACKWAMVLPRYGVQRRGAARGFAEFGSRYRHPLLFIAGMPKSGSTWLEQMVASFPGYREVLIPEASFAELRGEPGHVFELPSGAFDRLRRCLVLAKMHCPGTEGNVAVLRESGAPYVVLYRDPRDVAVSYIHYVRASPWHHDHPALRGLSDGEAIRHFIRRRLPEFARWMRSWRDRRDPERSLMLSYEELLDDPGGSLARVAELFELDADEATIRGILERNRFDKSRAAGSKFFRKGVAGDWKNHFDEDLKRDFKAVDGDLLVEFGYEGDLAW